MRPSPTWAGAVGVLLALTACADSDSTPTGSTPSSSTPSSSTPAGASSTTASLSAAIEIQVRVGEQCQPEPMTPGPSCFAPRPDAEVSLVNTSTDEVIEVRTDADGTARVEVSPGTYVVRAAAAAGNDAEPPKETVTVAPGGVAQVVLTFLVGFQ